MNWVMNWVSLERRVRRKSSCSFGGIQRVSARGIADALGLTSRAVEKHLSKLKQEGRLKCIGPAKGGRGEVIR